MKSSISNIRGMNDILPDISCKWREVEGILTRAAVKYGYNEIRTPILESSALFHRSIGQETDIVNKEMYTFNDRRDESLTLRPEGTACVARALIQAGLLRNIGQKVFYQGPMFRYERPQKGRARQFHQFGLEAFGLDGNGIEIEMLSYCANIWQELGISEKLTLEVNTLGSAECRIRYKSQLVDFFIKHKDSLTEEEQIRLEQNPLRLLDSKNPVIKELLTSAPKLIDVISYEEKIKFEELIASCDKLGIKYKFNPYLVRGLDYYNSTVFEWTTSELGAQGTVCAGGRYDSLVGTLTNGASTPAFGFAIGLERILELITIDTHKSGGVYIIGLCKEAELTIQSIAHTLRKELETKVVMDLLDGSIKNKFKRADKNNAQISLIFGVDEIANNTCTVKHLTTGEQEEITQENILVFLKNYFGE